MNRKPASVLVIAIIGIITSGFVLLFTPCGIYLLFKPVTPNPILEAMAKDHIYAVIVVSADVINFFLSLALLVLSIAALKLVSWARVGMMIYAAIVIAWAILFAALSFAYTVPALARVVDTYYPAQHVVIVVGGIVGGIIGFLYKLALPIAILICFRRTSVVNAFKGIFPAAVGNFPVDYPPQSPTA